MSHFTQRQHAIMQVRVETLSVWQYSMHIGVFTVFAYNLAGNTVCS